jgi:hypothetical protein
MVNKLKEEYISKGIPVPSDEEYQNRNGLVGGKRDFNLKRINFNSLCSNLYIFYFIFILIFYFILFLFSLILYYFRLNLLN